MNQGQGSDLSDIAEQRFKDGKECVKKATYYDEAKQFGGALSFYDEAVEAFYQACQFDQKYVHILPKVEAYARRAAEIRDAFTNNSIGYERRPSYSRRSSIQKNNLRQVEYLFEQAMLEDEAGKVEHAENLYLNTAEMALELVKEASNADEKAKLEMRAKLAIERVEDLKHISTDKKPQQQQAKPTAKPRSVGPLTAFKDGDSHSSKLVRSDAAKPAAKKGAKFTDEEVKILMANSRINGCLYVPWSDSDLVELRKVSKLGSKFEDPDGLPKLSEKQRRHLDHWVRPDDICEDPKMVYLVSSFTVKQTLIGDCSFVASLAISADYEKRFKTRLVTRCIYPQNRKGEPIINPTGKYMVCLNLNGCKRRVIIDDRLPLGHNGELLCSFSTNHDEFWVSLIEKAYIKVMGGYDFPGSSSNIDLHALTGWIPDRINLETCNKEETFRMIRSHLDKGNALITVATGPMGDDLSEKTGLVSAHAYAVLSIRDVNGIKLLQLKNPWMHQRWKGNYSESDKKNWTPELKKILNFDQTMAMSVDNGIFWIDYKSLCQFYSVVYINWKPDLFAHKCTLHGKWVAGNVKKDLFSVDGNPQYRLEVRAQHNATVWILLSRHITEKKDFAHNEKFITIHVSNKQNGRRVYYSGDYLKEGIKINTPHYLSKLTDIPRGTSLYTLIVAQFENVTIHYTLKVYSTVEFNLTKIHDPYNHQQEVQGQWKGSNAGGCCNYPTHINNPRYNLTVHPSYANQCQVLVKLQAPKAFSVGITCRGKDNDFRADSGPYRPGFVVLELSNLPGGSYTISPSTFTPGQEGPYILKVLSDCVMSFS